MRVGRIDQLVWDVATLQERYRDGNFECYLLEVGSDFIVLGFDDEDARREARTHLELRRLRCTNRLPNEFAEYRLMVEPRE